MPLRIVFMGTPEFSVPSLVELVGHGHEVVACYSQPPRPAGRRGLEIRKSPVHEKAEQFGIPVFTPLSLKGERELQQFQSHGADVAVVIAYGMLLPKAILETPRQGCFNAHASLLPRWRGAAPIQRAIMAGDETSGVSIMKMDEGLDTGPVALEEQVPITQEMSAQDLHDQLSMLSADLVIRTMGALERGSLALTPQPDDGVTYAHKISKEETRIDWNRPAHEVHNHIRALSPFPGAWCEMKISGNPHRVKVLETSLLGSSGKPGDIIDGELGVACSNNALRLVRVQRAGKQVQTSQEFLRGNVIEAVS